MQETKITEETARLAVKKGFTEEYCTCGGFPDCVCQYATCVPQSVLQKWLRDVHRIHICIQTTPVFDKTQGSMYKALVDYCFQSFKWTTGHYYLDSTYEGTLEKALAAALNLLPDCKYSKSPLT